MLEVLGVKNAQKLIPMDDDQKPQDPVTENQNILMGKPVKAFMYQDHTSHIMVHMSSMQDPKILSLLQNNPQAPTLQASMQNHINEHLGFEYRKQIELQLGMSLPPQKDESGEDVNMDPQVEARLAPLLAQAAKQLLQNNQSEQAKQQAQQQAQDPMVQMQQQELQIKQAEQQRKAQKDQADIQLKQEQLQVERERIEAQAKTAKNQTNISALSGMARLKNESQMEDKRQRIDGLKHLSQIKNQQTIQNKQLMADGLKTFIAQKNKPTKGEE
jgi:hypothetical protein